jgi:CheY-like chemotaxis protein
MPDRVLIIDDDPILRQMVRSILGCRYEASEAVDGPDGLAQAAPRPDIILLDS